MYPSAHRSRMSSQSAGASASSPSATRRLLRPSRERGFRAAAPPPPLTRRGAPTSPSSAAASPSSAARLGRARTALATAPPPRSAVERPPASPPPPTSSSSVGHSGSTSYLLSDGQKRRSMSTCFASAENSTRQRAMPASRRRSASVSATPLSLRSCLRSEEAALRSRSSRRMCGSPQLTASRISSLRDAQSLRSADWIARPSARLSSASMSSERR